MRAVRPIAVLGVLATSAALLAACGEDDEPGRTARAPTTAEQAGPAVNSATVNIASFKFLPAKVTLRRGGRITWVNQDRAPHTAENTGLRQQASFDTGRLDLGERSTITFNEPGTYRYYCVYHRFMEADVVVEQGA